MQWNIGSVGLQTQNSCVGPVHLMLFMSISFAFGSQRKRSFQWNMGFSPEHDFDIDSDFHKKAFYYFRIFC